MARVRTQITISLDGYVAGPRQRLEQPLGEGGFGLHGWATATRSWRAAHGGDGGTTGVDDDRIAATTAGVGATIMGRNMFGPVRGPWEDDAWRGWWGDEPPFHHPVIVLTHHPRAPLELVGTTFHFVTEGVEAALARAEALADGGDVSVAGGADTVRQFIRAGLLDELELHVVPLLLGDGERLLDGFGDAGIAFEQIEALGGADVAHLRYRLAR